MTYLKFKEVTFKECLITLMDICSLLKFQGRPLVRGVKGGFVKLNLKVTFLKGKNLPSFTKGGPFQRRLHETCPGVKISPDI